MHASLGAALHLFGDDPKISRQDCVEPVLSEGRHVDEADAEALQPILQCLGDRAGRALKMEAQGQRHHVREELPAYRLFGPAEKQHAQFAGEAAEPLRADIDAEQDNRRDDKAGRRGRRAGAR